MSLPPDMKIPFKGPLFRGMKGPDVKQLQRNLNTLNAYYEFNKREDMIPETGYFGDQTIRMVKEFQKFCKLPPSGMYEAKTHDLLEWKNYNRLYNSNLATQRWQQEQAKIKEAEDFAKRMKAVHKLFSDGRFGK